MTIVRGLLVGLIVAGSAAAELNRPDLPSVRDAVGWVIDEPDVLGEATENRLNEILASHEKATSNQVVVLTVADLRGEPIETVSLRRATELKIGRADKDNGVLVLLASNDRKVRIEVGYGLEHVLPDARCKAIIEERMIPAFKRGDYDSGVLGGVEAILASISGTYQPSVSERLGLPSLRVPALPILGLLLAMYLWRNYGPKPTAGSRTWSNSGSSGSSWGFSSSWSFSSGSSSSSSSSGFSGGGGSFGGGGASGSW